MKKRHILIADNKEKLKPSHRTELINMIKEISAGYESQLVDVRIGHNHIEIDIKIEDGKLGKFLEHVNRIFTIREVVRVDYDEDEEVDREKTIRKAIELFNTERFWETHEKLEKLWRESMEDEKEIIHAIILISAAYVHLQKNNLDRFFKVLNRALTALENTRLEQYYGIDVERIKDKVREIIHRQEVLFFKLA